MRARRVRDVQELLDLEARRWTGQPGERVALMAAPLGLQPTNYLRASWSSRAYGRCEAVHVACAHDGRRIVFHLHWASASESLAGGEAFPDAAAIALPVRGEPALVTMGSKQAPLHILHWEAGKEAVRSVLATGIGSSRPGPELAARASAVWKGGAWRVVVARPLEAPDGGASLSAGSTSKLGFAVWNGSNQERGGIKAFSLEWTPLELEA